MVNSEKLVEMNAENARMQKAFALVSPDAQGRHWKERIDAKVSQAALTHVGVTRRDVLDAIVYMTGTVGSVQAIEDGWHFTAPGYYAGPCN